MSPVTHMCHVKWRPACEHPWLWWGLTTVLMLLMATFTSPARADVTGPACVENGSVISINGKRSAGECVDGIPVRLYGVMAPTLAQECGVADGGTWRCGLASAAALLQAVKGREVECRGNSINAEGQLIAICFIAGRSVNQFMIELGWAEADRSVTSMFNDIEAEARAAQRGLWSSDFLRADQ